jgi:hypothetical protein
MVTLDRGLNQLAVKGDGLLDGLVAASCCRCHVMLRCEPISSHYQVALDAASAFAFSAAAPLGLLLVVHADARAQF